MKKKILVLLLVVTIGLGAAITLTINHYKIAKNGFQGKSYCNISQLMDCDTVLASSYSKMGPVLNSELGVLYYLFVMGALLLAWSRGEKQGRATLAFLFISSIFALSYSVFMAYLSFYKIGALCLFCMVTYVVNFLLLILLWWSLGIGTKIFSFFSQYLQGFFGKGSFTPHLLKHLIAVAVLAGIGIPLFRGLAPEAHRSSPKLPIEAYLKYFNELPKQEIVLPGPRPTWGDPNSKVTILEFSDFQCPFCRRAAFSLKPYLGTLRNQVKVVFMHYPLDQSCNPKITRSFHQNSCFAAKAAICADQQGKFWPYTERVFEQQPKISHDLLFEVAKQVGLNEETFKQCIFSPEVEQHIKEDLALGEQLNITGTPAIFINGRPFKEWMQPELFQAVVQSELQ